MGAPENLSIIRSHDEAGLIVGLVVASGDHDEAIDPAPFVGRVGVAARVHERINLPGDTVQITLQGLRRIIIEGVEQREPYAIARIRPAPETPLDPMNGEELMARLVNAAETLAELVDRIPDEVPAILKMNMSDPGRFADLAATNMNFRIADKDEVIQRLDIGERIRFVLTRLEREVQRARVMEDIKRQTEVKIEQHQREFYLRQQIRAIQAELGETDPGEKEAIDLLKKIEEAGLPEKVMQEARRETERMRMLSPAASEYQVIRTYLDWISRCRGTRSRATEKIELQKVKEALDVRHYGLGEAKQRILEYLAVRKLRGGGTHGPILCFVGPPGTGKTSLGEAIAISIGREFYRISVGGVRDEAEIRGHRRTYVGAMPGRCMQALRRVGVRDAVLMIDEIDKMTHGGMSGDPTAAMLEVLDPSQNHTFVDHYLNIPFDLSSRAVHLHREQSVRHSRAAARPNGDHPHRGLHDRGEGRDRVALSAAEAVRGDGNHATSICSSPTRCWASSRAAIRARRGCADSRATSSRSCASARTERRRARRARGSSTEDGRGDPRRRRTTRATRRRRSRRSARPRGSRGRRPVAS